MESLIYGTKLLKNQAFLEAFNLFQKFANIKRQTLRKKRPYSELFWSAFFRIRTEYGEILRISPHSVRMRENVDQNKCEYRHFLRTEISLKSL